MSFSARGSVHAARNVDEMIAAEWSLEDLRAEELYADFGVGDDGALQETARRQAEAAAREEQERAVREAYARGLEEGRREGEQTEATRLQNALRAAELALEEIREGEVRWLENIEENICALAVAIGRQIVDHELRVDPAVVQKLIRHALEEIPVAQPVRIRINPRDHAVLESHGSEGRLPSKIDGREAQWLPDASIVQGGCLVEGRDRIIDGRIDTALERVYRRLTYAVS